MVLERGRCLFIGGMEGILSPRRGGIQDIVRRPPLLELLLRLKKIHGDLRITSADPQEACGEIQRILSDQGQK
jgi:hypothetical protein